MRDLLLLIGGARAVTAESLLLKHPLLFIRVMVTNALSRMRVVEAVHHLVADEGTSGVMAPGWVHTELGGPDARLTIDRVAELNVKSA